MKWISGCPSAKRVTNVIEKAPVYEDRYGRPEFGEIHVLSTDVIGEAKSVDIERIVVQDPDVWSMWICVIPDTLDVPSRTRFVRLRVHPRNGRVLYAIGFLRECSYLERSTWGPISRFMPVTALGLPIDYEAK